MNRCGSSQSLFAGEKQCIGGGKKYPGHMWRVCFFISVCTAWYYSTVTSWCRDPLWHFLSCQIVVIFIFIMAVLFDPCGKCGSPDPCETYGSPSLPRSGYSSSSSSSNSSATQSYQCMWCFSVCLLWCSETYLLSLPRQPGKLPHTSSISNCLGIFYVCGQECTGPNMRLDMRKMRYSDEPGVEPG